MKDRIVRLRQEIARLRELEKDYDPGAVAELLALVEEMRALAEDLQKRVNAAEPDTEAGDDPGRAGR